MNNWFLWEKQHKKDCDFCTWSPDRIFGFNFWRACKRHDYGNANGIFYPGKGEIKKQRDLDKYFFFDLLDVVMRDATRIWGFMVPHVIIGFLLVVGYFLVVRATHRFWYKGKANG